MQVAHKITGAGQQNVGVTLMEEKRRLKELTSIVHAKMPFVFEVGMALVEIRDSRLYRHTHSTFEQFCEAEFAVGRSYAHRLIEAAVTRAALPPAAAAKIVSEGQARELRKVPEAQREEVLERAASSGKVTAKGIGQAAKATKADKNGGAGKVIELDKTGCAIPESILADWQYAESFDGMLRQLQQIKLDTERGVGEQDIAFREVTNSTVADLKNILSDLKRIIPFAVCTTCSGIDRAQCSLCGKRGFLSKFLYETAVPEKTRSMREGKK